MLITYLDDSGSVSNINERHYILAGICIFEGQVFFLEDALDSVVEATGFAGNPKDLELHGNAIYARRRVWRQFGSKEEARQLILQALQAGNRAKDWRLFGVVVDKERCREDPAEYAFEQICSRVDYYLHRRKQNLKNISDDYHRGLLVLDKSRRETRLQELATQFRQVGHRWGKSLRYFADVPFFVDSKATRLVQYADLVCYALWRKYEKNDPEFFQVIQDKFDADGGTQHGLLYHPPAL